MRTFEDAAHLLAQTLMDYMRDQGVMIAPGYKVELRIRPVPEIAVEQRNCLYLHSPAMPLQTSEAVN